MTTTTTETRNALGTITLEQRLDGKWTVTRRYADRVIRTRPSSEKTARAVYRALTHFVPTSR